MTTKDARIYIRVTDETKRRIEAAAAADRRSMAEWLIVLAERELARLERPDVQHEREMLKYR